MNKIKIKTMPELYGKNRNNLKTSKGKNLQCVKQSTEDKDI